MLKINSHTAIEAFNSVQKSTQKVDYHTAKDPSQSDAAKLAAESLKVTSKAPEVLRLSSGTLYDVVYELGPLLQARAQPRKDSELQIPKVDVWA